MDNFVVSARKYRPDTFESVVGQQHVTTTLQNAIRTNQLAQVRPWSRSLIRHLQPPPSPRQPELQHPTLSNEESPVDFR